LIRKTCTNTERSFNGASHGVLDVRRDRTWYEGEFRQIIKGTNEVIDTFVKPSSQGMKKQANLQPLTSLFNMIQKHILKKNLKIKKSVLNFSSKCVSGAVSAIQDQLVVLTSNPEEKSASTEEVAAINSLLKEPDKDG
jgi:hypothetical protein